MKSLLNKKSVLVLTIVAVLFLSLSIFAFSTDKNVYAEKGDSVLDADVLSFDGRPEIVPKLDSNNFFQSGTDNYIIETQVTKANPNAKLSASYPDKIYGGNNDALSVEVRLLFNRWPDLGYGGVSDDATYMALKIYNSSDTLNPIADAISYETTGNFVRTLRLSPEKVCNHRGRLQGFVISVESDASSWLSSIIIDYVKIVFTTNSEGDSAILLAGDCVAGENPQNITDANVVWTKAEGYSDTFIDYTQYGGLDGYVANPAFVSLRKEKLPTVDCRQESDGTETLLLQNAVFAFNVGNISAENYSQFLMDLLLSDKRKKGDHTLYLYGSNIDKFVDDSGDPVGYVAKITVKDYEQGFHNKFLLEGEEVRKLAGNDGKVSYIYVLYHGNTLDTASETVGLRDGSQIWVNKIQFLIESDVEKPVIASEYDSYDVSDIFPVGERVTIENKVQNNIGDMVSVAVLRNKQVGELSFNLTMSGGDEVSLLFNGKSVKKVNGYSDGGVLFCLSDEEIEISSHIGGERMKAIFAVPESAFTTKTAVKIKCVPYYLNSVEAGLYCAVYINGEEAVSGYFRSDYLDLGNALHLCYKVTDRDFAVEIASSKTSGITSAEDLMNVRVRAEEIRYSYDRTDIPLSFAWYNTGFDEMSEVKCESEVATLNRETKRVGFSDNGEAKISFSITNVFGTFESEVFSVSCEDAVVLSQAVNNFNESVWFIVLCVLPVAILVAVSVILTIKKAKSAKSGK